MAGAMEFTYRREGCRAFPQMVEAVERSVRSHGFDVVRRHDLQATLAAKGFAIQPLVVLDIAAPGSEVDLCKMQVYAEGDVVWVSAIRPVALWREIRGGDDSDGSQAEAWVVAVVDAACC
ncbi:MAG: hypothetical protein ACYC6J_02010 [Coriobacteriia bacterium]